MTINTSSQTLGAWFLRALGIAGVVVGAINPTQVPTGERPWFLIASAIVFAVDRYVSDPTTGSGPAKPTTPPTSPGSTQTLP